MRNMFRALCTSLLLVAACVAPDTFAPVIGQVTMQQVAGATTPHLEVLHLAAGAPVHIDVIGMQPNQTVALFVGTPLVGAACGTRVRANLGGCLDIRNAQLIGHHVADGNGEVIIDLIAPVNLPRPNYAFQAVSPGRAALQSNVVVKYPMLSWIECETDPLGVPSLALRGDSRVKVGTIVLTAHNGDMDIDMVHFDHLGDPAAYYSVSIYDGTRRVMGPEMLSANNETEFHDRYIVAANTSALLDLVADLTDPYAVTVSQDTSQFVLTSVEASDVNGEFIPWTGIVWSAPVTLVDTLVTVTPAGPSVGTLSNGNLPVWEGAFAASAQEDADITSLRLRVQGVGGALSCENWNALEIKDAWRQGISGTLMVEDANGGSCSNPGDTVAWVTLSPDPNQMLIPAGSWKQFEISTDMLGAAQGDSLQLVLDQVCWSDGTRTVCDDSVQVQGIALNW